MINVNQLIIKIFVVLATIIQIYILKYTKSTCKLCNYILGLDYN